MGFSLTEKGRVVAGMLGDDKAFQAYKKKTG
jgi:hypothetical protein